jgi:hypothetical protein
MKPLELSRQLKVEKYEAIMEIGRQQRREELLAVLMLAEEHGGRASPKDVSQELLQGRPELVGKAIVDRCTDLGLLDETGTITQIGKQALRTGNVFIPEKGRYILWFTDDPLVAQKVIHIEPKEESQLNDEVAAIKNRATNQTPKPEPLPQKIMDLPGGIYELMGKDGGTVVIRSIEAQGLTCPLGPNDNARITLRIDHTGSRLNISGSFERLLKAPSLDFEEVWVSALGSLAKLWANSREPPALKTSFDELSPKELASFSKTVFLSRPTIVGYGEFDDTSVDDVPIFPKTSADAASWAKWILKRSVNAYTDEERYKSLVDTCKSRFPDFPGIELPDAEKLAAELATEKDIDGALPKAYWYLQAPLDLRMTKS